MPVVEVPVKNNATAAEKLAALRNLKGIDMALLLAES